MEVEAIDQGGGIAGLSLYQNGARVPSQGAEPRAAKTVRKIFHVPLVAGVNRFRVATNAAGGWEAEPAQFVLDQAETAAKGRLFVVAVGINSYEDEQLNLRFSSDDARAFAALFQRRGGDCYEQVVAATVLDRQASRDGIRRAVRKLAAETRPQDTLVVFFAGHGLMIGQRYYYLPSDARVQNEDDVRQQAIPGDEISDFLCDAGGKCWRKSTRWPAPAT